MSTTRKQQPKAIITQGRHGDFTVQLPDGRAVLAETLEDAKRIAHWGGALLIEWRVPMAVVAAARG